MVRGPSVGGPPNVTLSGNQSELIAGSETVGNITLSGNATLVVENVSSPPTLTVEGNIALNDTAHFLVEHATLAIAESYNVERSIQMFDRASFGVAYANVTTSGLQWGAALYGSSNLTVLDSYFCYPSGWVDTTLIQNASIYLVLSYYLSDVILFDNPLAPSTARVRTIDAVGFNLWLNFRNGTSANLTLPGPARWENWSFPGSSPETGIGYRVDISYSFVQLFAVMLWQGASLTVHDSLDFVVALDLDYGQVVLNALREGHYPSLAMVTNGIDLHLRNTTVFTWNIYPFAGSVEIKNSQIGEVQLYDSASAAILAGNLTGHGGYYGNQGTGTFVVDDSTLASQFVATAGTTYLNNCRFAPPIPEQILAAATGTIEARDVRLGAGDSYAALAQGTIRVAWTLNVSVYRVAGNGSDLSVPGALLELEQVQGWSVQVSGLSDANGDWNGIAAVGGTITASGTTNASLALLATQAVYGGGELALPRLGADLAVRLQIVPQLVSWSPASGTANIAPGPYDMSLRFAFPMSPAAVVGNLTLLPSVSPTFSWLPGSNNTTLEIRAALAAGANYTMALGTGAATALGLPLAARFVLNFSTSTPLPFPGPRIVATYPSAGATLVGRNSSVVLGFDQPMNDSSVVRAFSIEPSAGGAFSYPAAETIKWTPTAELAAGTLYTVRLNTTARGYGGYALASNFTLTFTTAGTAAGHGGPNSSSPRGASSSGGFPLALYAAIVTVGLAAAVGLELFRLRRKRGPAPPPPG